MFFWLWNLLFYTVHDAIHGGYGGVQGKQAVEDLGNYVVTVKTKYLIIMSLYYSSVRDTTRVQMETEDFNRQLTNKT